MDSSAEQLRSAAGMSASIDDLGDLFEFGDIDLSNLANGSDLLFVDPSQMLQPPSHGSAHATTPYDESSEMHPFGGPHLQGFTMADSFGMPQDTSASHLHIQSAKDSDQMANYSLVPEHLHHANLQHTYSSRQPQPQPQPSQYQYQQSNLGRNQIPPTPNSYEMHGEAGAFLNQPLQDAMQSHAGTDPNYALRKDEAVLYTPIVSPAITPQFGMRPEYTMPGAYSFSPLTSPMLHAQNAQHLLNQQQMQHGYVTNPSTAPSSSHTSPVENSVDIDMLGDGQSRPPSAKLTARRTARKNAPPRGAAPGTKARPSTAQRAQKRDSTAFSTEVNGVLSPMQRASISAPLSASTQGSQLFYSSGADSVSPEPLSESLMRPPPRPVSNAGRSPAIAAQQQGPLLENGVAPAATPKSLLSSGNSKHLGQGQLNTASQTASHTSDNSATLDDLILPEAAREQHSRTPSLARLDTKTSTAPPTTEQQTPRTSSRKTPKLGTTSTPASSERLASLASPSVTGSPMAASTPAALLKEGSKGSRSSKKRSSIVGAPAKLLSPAIVPKISPSIKPLLPEGTPLSSATQAMLLASKSNYQNLLEGNHLPGVVYPDSLSTGLTSKRTSHKVAEQGRRNRINEALKEMQALIPRGTSNGSASGDASSGNKLTSQESEKGGVADDGEAGNGEDDDNKDGSSKADDAAARAQGSKAATVELANEYIRKMQKENAVQIADLMQLRRENEELRRRLGIPAEQAVSASDDKASPLATGKTASEYQEASSVVTGSEDMEGVAKG